MLFITVKVESPSQKWPDVFSDSSVFGKHPYLLPCGIAGGITLVGAGLSSFLDRDAGLRKGSVKLQAEESNVDDNNQLLARLQYGPMTLIKGIVSYTLGLFRIRHQTSTSNENFSTTATISSDILPLTDRLAGGSSYSLDRIRNQSLEGGNFPHRTTIPRSIDANAPSRGHLGFTKRLLIANERRITTMSDFWVNAVMTESKFQQDLLTPTLEFDSTRRPDHIPSIFNHTGLRRQRVGLRRWPSENATADDDGRHLGLEQPSLLLMSQLPAAVILQYGLLALHSTIHDQIFLSYLVS